MTLESDKTLGGLGAILMAIGVLPFLGVYTGAISLVGLVLVLIAVKGLADYHNDASIFNNALYGVVTAIVGGIIFIAIIVNAALGLVSALGIDLANWHDWMMFQRIDWRNMITFDVIWPYVTVIFLSLVMLFIFAIVTAIFLRRSLNTLSTKTRVGMFWTTGIMVLIGAILTIVAIGFVLLWIAMILLAVAFFSIPIQTAQPTATTPAQAQQ
jgi:uncharacterized membrane protein